VEKCTAGQDIDAICIACWIIKVTNTHTGHVIVNDFPLQQWLGVHCLSSYKINAQVVTKFLTNSNNTCTAIFHNCGCIHCLCCCARLSVVSSASTTPFCIHLVTIVPQVFIVYYEIYNRQ